MKGTQPPAAPSGPLPATGVRNPDAGERSGLVVFRGGNVVDVVAGLLLPRHDLLIRDGRVAAVAPDVPSAGARVVDVSGRYLCPGLLSLHVHPGMMVGLRMDANGLDSGRIQRDLEVWARYGVTTVQALGTDRDLVFDTIGRQRSGEFSGARLFSVGHGFGTQGGVPPFAMDPPGPVTLTDPAEIAALLATLARRGASGVKLWYDDWYGQFPKMPLEVVRSILEGCRRNGLKSYAHVYRLDDAALLIGMGLDVLAHMPRDRGVDAPFSELMLARGTAVIPTLTVPETNYAYVERPDWVRDPLFERFLPPGSAAYLQDEAVLAAIRARPEFPEQQADLRRALGNVAALHRAGVTVGFGTDSGVSNRVVGFAEHRELELLETCGLSAADALRMATATSAQILGQGDQLGQLAPGYRADLLVLRANPLLGTRALRQIDSVWQDGAQLCGALV